MAVECIGAKTEPDEDGEEVPDEFEVTLESLLAASPGFATRVTVALCLSNASDAVETLSLGFALPLLNFGDLRWPAAAVFFGMLTGGCAAGTLAERFGHKRLLVMMLYLEALAAVATTAATFGPRGDFLRHRSLSLIASSFISGSVLVSLLAWPLSLGWTWQAFYASTGLVPLLNAFLVSCWIPESPSFLQQQGRRAELLGELQHFAGLRAAGPAFRVAQEMSWAGDAGDVTEQRH
eukprot:g23617.t1